MFGIRGRRPTLEGRMKDLQENIAEQNEQWAERRMEDFRSTCNEQTSTKVVYLDHVVGYVRGVKFGECLIEDTSFLDKWGTPPASASFELLRRINGADVRKYVVLEVVTDAAFPESLHDLSFIYCGVDLNSNLKLGDMLSIEEVESPIPDMLHVLMRDQKPDYSLRVVLIKYLIEEQ